MNECHTAIHRLKASLDAPEQECYVIPDSKSICIFKAYIKHLILAPDEAIIKIKKVLFLYIGCIRYAILSFEDDHILDKELMQDCDTLAKTLYASYKDVNTLLRMRQIEYLWKAYSNLREAARKVPSSSFDRESIGRERLMYKLHVISERVRKMGS